VTESRLEKACIDSNYKGVTIVDGVDISNIVQAFQLYANIFMDMPSDNTSKLHY
jgi:hypothetical protein